MAAFHIQYGGSVDVDGLLAGSQPISHLDPSSKSGASSRGPVAVVRGEERLKDDQPDATGCRDIEVTAPKFHKSGGGESLVVWGQFPPPVALKIFCLPRFLPPLILPLSFHFTDLRNVTPELSSRVVRRTLYSDRPSNLQGPIASGHGKLHVLQDLDQPRRLPNHRS